MVFNKENPKLFVLFIFIAILILAGVCYASWIFYFKEAYQKTPASQTQTSNTDSIKDQPQQNEYSDWLTYTNDEIGYSLKYPKNWTIKETNSKSEITDEMVKYISIYVPDQKYMLNWGAKKKSDKFALTDRTGVGGTEENEYPEEAFKILNVSVIPKSVGDNGKIKDYFYPQPEGTTAEGGLEFLVFFSYNSSKINYDLANLNNSEYLPIVKKILKSVTAL